MYKYTSELRADELGNDPILFVSIAEFMAFTMNANANIVSNFGNPLWTSLIVYQ
jgi:hypothetical protein